ncbi:hypothetical protein F5X68DRAFT_201386 [Plectosphaerella plurivora]|uniref:Uncharacterized protein n=1 Tax=Plectosphaerella plurivora TaxID=936078 RepID=A0A9P8VIB5_9PEZI|nr:hypothetical protein F5X68DRAFT_201386 [Plectosphaerella plurivora]
MASMSQVQCCSSHELGDMANALSTTAIGNFQAPSIDPSSVGSAENGTTGGQIPDTSVSGTQTASVARWWLGVGNLGILLWEMWHGPPSSGTSPTALGSFDRITTNFSAWLSCTSRDGQNAKPVSWGKVMAFAACVATIVTVWPTHQSAAEASKALALSLWTATKDYYEFCEGHEWMPPNCDSVRDVPPDPLPVLEPGT